MRCIMLLAVLGTGFASAVSVCAQDPAQHAATVVALEKMGAKVEVDAKHPDRPIISVDL